MLIIFVTAAWLTAMSQMGKDEAPKSRTMVAVPVVMTVPRAENMARNTDAQNRLQCARFNDSNADATLNLVSLFTSNSTFYYKQAMMLNRSVQRFMPEINFNMLVTSDVDPQMTRDLSDQINVHVVEPFEEPERPSTAYMSSSWIHQLTKIKLWSFNECNLLCYVDSDIVFYNDAMVRLAQDCWSQMHKPPSTPDEPRVRVCAFEQSCADGQFGRNREFWGMRYFQASLFCLMPGEELYTQLLNDIVGQFDSFANGSKPMNGKFVFTEQVRVHSLVRCWSEFFLFRHVPRRMP